MRNTFNAVLLSGVLCTFVGTVFAQESDASHPETSVGIASATKKSEASTKKKVGIVRRMLKPVTDLQTQSIKLQEQIIKLERPIESLHPPIIELSERVLAVDGQLSKLQNTHC